MTHTVELPPLFEEIAARQAQKDGKSVGEYLPELITKALIQEETRPGILENETLKTGDDLLSLWEQEDAFLPLEEMPDSPVYARQLREESQRPREH